MIQVGDIVRILVPGSFYGQEKEVLRVNRRKTRCSYLVKVIWPNPEHVRPSWFAENEVQLVRKQVEQVD